MLELLTNPNEFFRRRVGNPGLVVPLCIVLLTAIVAAVGVIPRAELSAQLVSDATQAQGQQLNESTAETVGAVSAFFGIALAFVVVLVTWVLYSAAFYLLARFAFDGTGSFKNTFAFTGWGYVPLLVHHLSSAAATYYVLSGVSLPETTRAAQDTFRELQNDPILLATGVLGLAMLAWSGVIWTAAMGRLHDLSRRNAGLTVGIPVGIAFVLRIIGLL